jgi:hypothetical protein
MLPLPCDMKRFQEFGSAEGPVFSALQRYAVIQLNLDPAVDRLSFFGEGLGQSHWRPFFAFTHWVSTLRTRLRVCRADWRCCSSLQGWPCGLVAPSPTARQTHTRARPTAGSRLKRALAR